MSQENSGAQNRSGPDRRQAHASVDQGQERRVNVRDRRAEANLRYATFRIQKDLFAIDVMRVQEVILNQPRTRVPLAPGHIRGLMNLRGQVVPIFDMRRVLGYPDFSPTVEPIHMIVTHAEGPISLLVDEQGDYLEVSRSHFRPVPETIEPNLARRLTGVCCLRDLVLLVLDVDGSVGVGGAVEADS